jgi:hypothetical protein
MAEPRTLAIDEPFDDIDDELRHTEMSLKANLATAQLALPFSALRVEIRKRRDEEAKLLDALAFARALVVSADDTLNGLVDETKKAVLAASGQDYAAPLYRQLFGGQSPSELKKPVLGAQLAAMRVWVGPLGAADAAALNAISTDLVPAIAKADEALTAVSLAEQNMDAFVAGARATTISETNALRKLTKGKISEMAHARPEFQLPADFADRFFLASSGSRAPTAAELGQSIARAEAKVERLKAQLAAMKDKEAKLLKSKQEAELAEKQAELDAAQKKAAAATEEIARLKAELEGR